MCKKPSNTGTFGVCGQKSDVPKSSKYRFEGTSPEGGFQPRVNDIDVGGSRVNRIDVSGFSGPVCEQVGCFLEFFLCVGTGQDKWHNRAIYVMINR